MTAQYSYNLIYIGKFIYWKNYYFDYCKSFQYWEDNNEELVGVVAMAIFFFFSSLVVVTRNSNTDSGHDENQGEITPLSTDTVSLKTFIGEFYDWTTGGETAGDVW